MSNEVAAAPAGDPNGEHNVEGGDVPHYHVNILLVVKNAKDEYERKTGGTAKFFYAPEALLFLVDKAVKDAAHVAGSVDDETLSHASVTHVYGMELLAVSGTCLTVTELPMHGEDDTVSGVMAPGVVES